MTLTTPDQRLIVRVSGGMSCGEGVFVSIYPPDSLRCAGQYAKAMARVHCAAAAFYLEKDGAIGPVAKTMKVRRPRRQRTGDGLRYSKGIGAVLGVLLAETEGVLDLLLSGTFIEYGLNLSLVVVIFFHILVVSR